MHMHMIIFVDQEKIHLLSKKKKRKKLSLLSFFSILEKKFVGGSREKTLNPTIYFPSFLLNQTHFKKVFLFIFSPKFFI